MVLELGWFFFVFFSSGVKRSLYVSKYNFGILKKNYLGVAYRNILSQETEKFVHRKYCLLEHLIGEAEWATFEMGIGLSVGQVVL